MPLKRSVRRTNRPLLGHSSRHRKSRKSVAHKRQISALTGGNKSGKMQKAVATPRRAFLSFHANQPPQNLYATLKVSDFGNLDYTTWQQTFYANSCFDPTGTLGAGKPRYYDTFCGADNTAALYRRYRVHEAMYSFDVTNLAAAPILFGVSTYRTGITGVPSVTALDEARTRSDTRTIVVTGNQSGKATQNLKVRVPVKVLMGNKDLSDDDRTAALYNANPVEIIRVQIFIMPLDGADVSISANVSAQCLQKVQFFELNDVADS